MGGDGRLAHLWSVTKEAAPSFRALGDTVGTTVVSESSRAMTGYSYWNTANGDDTMVTLWNPADEAQNLVFTLFFAGGSYRYPVPLGPRATRTFNVSEIIQNQLPDENGNTIPAGVHEGSAEIAGIQAEQEHILVAMAAGTYNVRKATCAGNCIRCDGYTGVDEFDLIELLGAGQTTSATYSLLNNSGNYVNVSSSSTWRSSSASIATASIPGTVTGITPGTFTAYATTGYEPEFDPFDCPTCDNQNCPTEQFTGSGPSRVTPKPTISSLDPNPIMIGTSPPNGQLTINGSNFGTSPIVNLPAGVTSTGQGSTDTQIILTGVSVALTAAVGNNNVTVSVNGATSSPASLTVDGPYQMVVQSDVTGPCSGCATTVQRNITYQIRNFSGENAGTTSICETPTYSGWNCSQAQNIQYAQCSAPESTNGTGVFTDDWSLNSDGYTPAGCGLNVLDHWDWAAHSPVQDLGTLTGYLHTNAVSIDGVVSPNKIPAGTVIPF